MEDNKLIIYKNSEGNIIVDAIYKDETLWLSQKGMSKVLSYVHHNGINPMILSYYFNDFINVGLEGPNNISLNFIHELKIKEDMKNYL